MRKKVTVTKMVAVFLMAATALVAVPRAAQAQSTKDKVGITMLLSGIGLTFGAFNYASGIETCPTGYTKHVIDTKGYDGTPIHDVSCVRIFSNGDSRVQDADVVGGGMTLARKPLLWSGLGAMGTSVILFVLPEKAQKTARNATNGLDVMVTPKGWWASKRFIW